MKKVWKGLGCRGSRRAPGEREHHGVGLGFRGDRSRAGFGGRRTQVLRKVLCGRGGGRMVSEGHDTVFVSVGREFSAPYSTRA